MDGANGWRTVVADGIKKQPSRLRLALLGVLLDRIARLVGGALHLSLRLLGDLAEEVVCAVGVLEVNTMPGAHIGAVLGEKKAVVERV